MSQGEGSRGGHITGHTKSGAPIYGSPRSAQQNAATVKKAGRIVALAGGVLAGLTSKHINLSINRMESAGARNPLHMAMAAGRRAGPLAAGAFVGSITGVTLGSYGSEAESRAKGDGYFTQQAKSIAEAAIDVGIVAGADYTTQVAYDALKKVGPGIREGVETGIKATKYAGLKTAQAGMRATRGIRNFAKFARATPFETQAFTSASRFLTHIKR